MKNFILLTFTLLFCSIMDAQEFISTWETTTGFETITIPTTGTGYNYTVNWGDGTSNTTHTGDATHTYTLPETHTVSISGSFPRIYFNNTGDKDKIKDITQWGTIEWTSMENAFLGCTNLQVSATDAPDLSSVTYLINMFYFCANFNSNINHWDVSTITHMTSMIEATSFNQPLNNWDVSNAIDMTAMFRNTPFNRPLNNWNVSNVTNMREIFFSASSFNQDISMWNTHKVTNMKDVFNGATAFNQDLGNWDLSSVTAMDRMFLNAGLSTTNYDATLIGWATDSNFIPNDGTDDVPTNITFDAGNSTYCSSINQRQSLIDTYNWTITDAGLDCDTPPTAICQDFTAQLDATGNVTILPSDIDNGSSDPDGPVTLSLDSDTFDCSNIGANTVTLTVTDNAGNTATCTATVTVEDSIAPTLTCPADINLTCPTQVTYSLTTISDNCSFGVPTVVAGFSLLGNLDQSTYFLSDTDVTGVTAFNDAMVNGYKIVTINNAQENQYIADQLTIAGIGSVLIGFNDLATEGSFVWQSGQPNSYTNWNNGEPNNANAGEDYTELSNNGGWNDVGEVGTGRYIIEFTDGIIQIVGLPSGSFFPNGTTTNTFYIEDASGNGTTCSFNVVIDDSEAPTITCPTNITIGNDLGECGATLNIPLPVITDNCGNMLIPDTFMVPYNFDINGELIDTPSTLLNLTTHTTDVLIELTFSGDHNSTNEEFILTGPDAVVIFSENDIIGSTSCVITTRLITIPQTTWNNWITTFGANLSFTLLADSSVDDDQCDDSPNNFYRLRAIQFGDISVVNDYTGTQDASGDYPVGTTTVTWTATDLAGNTANCIRTIVVNDTEAPVITNCPLNTVTNNDIGECGAIVNFDSPTVSDNCTHFENTLGNTLQNFNANAAVTTALIPNPFNFIMDGPSGVNSIRIDDGGNGNHGDMYDGGNFITTDLSTGAINYSDNVIISNGSFGPNGAYVTRKVNNMWLLAADLDGVNDFNITGGLGADGDGVADGFTSTITVDGTNYNIFVKRVREEPGVIGTDPSVNHLIIIPENAAATHNFSTDTDDDQHQITGLTGTSRLYYLLFASIDSGLIDNAAMESIASSFITTNFTPIASLVQTAGLASGSVFPVGTTTNTFTATDAAGNIATCSFDVTVNDTEFPDIVCASGDITTNTDAGICGATVVFADPTASDNCSVTVTQTAGLPSGSVFPVGITTIEYTATDPSNNGISCSFTITVEDNEPPVVVCQDITIDLDASGNATITAADVDGGSTDNCGIATLAIDIDTFDCSNVGPNNVTLTITDVNGNGSFCTAIVTVVDVLAPELICPTNQTVTVNQGEQYELLGYFATGEATAIDNCTDSVTITSQDPAIGTLLNPGVHTIILTAEDEYGNSATCEFDLTVDEVLGVNDNTVDISSVILYPNPVRNYVNISNPQSIELDQITIYDLNGRLVKKESLKQMGTDKIINVSELSSAIYMVIISGSNVQITKQIIKE